MYISYSMLDSDRKKILKTLKYLEKTYQDNLVKITHLYSDIEKRIDVLNSHLKNKLPNDIFFILHQFNFEGSIDWDEEENLSIEWQRLLISLNNLALKLRE